MRSYVVPDISSSRLDTRLTTLDTELSQSQPLIRLTINWIWFNTSWMCRWQPLNHGF